MLLMFPVRGWRAARFGASFIRRVMGSGQGLLKTGLTAKILLEDVGAEFRIF